MTSSSLSFMDENFLLESPAARKLYFDYARELPIIDYHNHLPPHDIANDINFKNLTHIWLKGDHYKWRAMRTYGIEESFITGKASDWEKFQKWAETAPYTIRNPLYHWTHLELRRYFNIDQLLNTDSAKHIYETANELLALPSYSTRSLLQRMKVEVLCTTDDPLDNLEAHQELAKEHRFNVYPTWRPDKLTAWNDSNDFIIYLNKLEEVTNLNINNIDDLLEAILKRHNHFSEHGCRLSDHGLEYLPWATFTGAQVEKAFTKLRAGHDLKEEEKLSLRCYLLMELAKMDHSRNWVQQFHLGAMRNNSYLNFKSLGPDSGFDSIGDYPQAYALSRFLDALDRDEKLAKTIIYNLNPSQNEVVATMIGNFSYGGIKGKLQFGSGWWFLDQLDGMERQLNALSNMSLLSCFVGMLTDSRSFLSFPRHEYFRRLLCNLLGRDIDTGKLPEDYSLIGKIVQEVCYYNARQYFGFDDID